MKGYLVGSLFLLLDCKAFCAPETAVTVFESSNMLHAEIDGNFENIGNLVKNDDFWAPLGDACMRGNSEEKLRWEEKKQLLDSIRVFGEYKKEGRIIAGYYSVLTMRGWLGNRSNFYKDAWEAWMNSCETVLGGVYNLVKENEYGATLLDLLRERSDENDNWYTDEEVEKIGEPFKIPVDDSPVATGSSIPETESGSSNTDSAMSDSEEDNSGGSSPEIVPIHEPAKKTIRIEAEVKGL